MSSAATTGVVKCCCDAGYLSVFLWRISLWIRSPQGYTLLKGAGGRALVLMRRNHIVVVTVWITKQLVHQELKTSYTTFVLCVRVRLLRCVCVCVGERERVRERARKRMSVCARVSPSTL
jgi:hypothetical protein